MGIKDIIHIHARLSAQDGLVSVLLGVCFCVLPH